MTVQRHPSWIEREEIQEQNHTFENGPTLNPNSKMGLSDIERFRCMKIKLWLILRIRDSRSVINSRKWSDFGLVTEQVDFNLFRHRQDHFQKYDSALGLLFALTNPSVTPVSPGDTPVSPQCHRVTLQCHPSVTG